MEEKILILKKDIDPVHVPKYDELSVKNLWPMFAKEGKLMKYFPDNFANDKGPSRQYFFDILNTKEPEYLNKVMAHANEQRMSASSDLNQSQFTLISEAWQEKLRSLPYLSRK